MMATPVRRDAEIMKQPLLDGPETKDRDRIDFPSVQNEINF
jgi:hypothetical protein